MKPTPDIIRFDQRLKREREARERRAFIRSCAIDGLLFLIMMAGIYWAVMFLAVVIMPLEPISQ